MISYCLDSRNGQMIQNCDCMIAKKRRKRKKRWAKKDGGHRSPPMVPVCLKASQKSAPPDFGRRALYCFQNSRQQSYDGVSEAGRQPLPNLPGAAAALPQKLLSGGVQRCVVPPYAEQTGSWCRQGILSEDVCSTSSTHSRAISSTGCTMVEQHRSWSPRRCAPS